MGLESGVPLHEEVVRCLDRVRKIVGMGWSEFNLALGYPKGEISTIKAYTRPVSALYVSQMRLRLIGLIDKELDPTYCPVGGLEKEWFIFVQAARDFLKKDIDKAMNFYMEHREPTRGEKRLERRKAWQERKTSTRKKRPRGTQESEPTSS